MPTPRDEILIDSLESLSAGQPWNMECPVGESAAGWGYTCAQALVVANTFGAMAIDVESRAFRLSRGRGGLSGPGIHPIVVRMVHDVYRSVARDAKVPIIALGGVTNWRDAAEFVLAGATAVAMGTALFIDPRSPLAVVDGLAEWVRRQGCSSINELIGTATLREVNASPAKA